MDTDYTIPHDERLWRHFKGERNTAPSKNHSLSLASIRRFLGKYDYLFILWLSPIGIIFIFCLWQICAHGLELAPSKWEFWKWVIDKTVYIGSILFVALLAQKVFNDNARNRENRERRLQRIEDMIGNTTTITQVFKAMLAAPINEVAGNFEKMSGLITAIQAYSSAYRFGLEPNINQLEGSLENIRREFIQCINASNAQPQNGTIRVINLASQANVSTADTCLTNTLDALIQLHQDVEYGNTTP